MSAGAHAPMTRKRKAGTWLLLIAMAMLGGLYWVYQQPNFWREDRKIRAKYNLFHSVNASQMDDDADPIVERVKDRGKITQQDRHQLRDALEEKVEMSNDLEEDQNDLLAELQGAVPKRAIQIKPDQGDWLPFGRLTGDVMIRVTGCIDGVCSNADVPEGKAKQYAVTPWVVEIERAKFRDPSTTYISYRKPVIAITRNGQTRIEGIYDRMVKCQGQGGESSVWFNEQDKPSVFTYNQFKEGRYSVWVSRRPADKAYAKSVCDAQRAAAN